MHNISGKVGKQSPLKIKIKTLDISNMDKFKDHLWRLKSNGGTS